MANVSTEVADPPTPPVPTAANRYHPGAFIEMLVSSIIGLVASLVLSIDAIALAEDPLADLSCNISSTISCATVGLTWQANLLGFPNAFLGLIAEPVVITIAVAALGGVRFPRWFMLSAQVVYSIGLAFAYWLFYQAYFVIGAMCPWCMLITITTTLVFASMTRVNILEGHFGARAKQRLERPLRLGLDAAGVVIVLAILAAMVIYKYV
ncbi:MAG: vitamin K epoxide reductase family protein [Actinomycetota bacterium]|nr:vitamin K epoxide reductase family protein [Actinomycetota bacterium]MDH4015827.1 vitamin K epoxide reductase family protein [Actinomycetota bacterium]